ncbi:MAG: pitrilysin family protein [Flammeovirgaceae bacterium]
MKTLRRLFAAFLALAVLIGSVSSCKKEATESPEKDSNAKKLSIDYERYKLSNGLEVILHQDKSDPIVAVAILFHVGSNREKPGRTGFAHFFEHMLFQKSENVPQGGFFKKIDELGGTFNGGTWTDGTIYYEVVPKDAIEKVLWMESDRMGFLINAVTKASLEGEKPVVQNEKRQRYDNAPYGHTNYVINKALYPADHPYNWLTIGELEDLQNATLDDVKEFYNKYYGPNNASMVIAGDFDKEQVKAMVEKYFGEIPAKPAVEPIKPRPGVLEKTIKITHEDNFAQLPELTMVFNTVEESHPDAKALEVLGRLLYEGKRAPLYKVLVEEKKLAPSPVSYNDAAEIAGKFVIKARGHAGVDTDSLELAVIEALNKFEKEGFSDNDMSRIKNALETDFYNGITSILNKSFQLVQYAVFYGDPGYITKDIEKTLAVSREDVMRVFNTYIKGKPYIATSFVPKGQTDLSLTNAVKATVVEEALGQDNKKEYIPSEEDMKFEKTPSKIDRTVEPALGTAPVLTPRNIWSGIMENGLKVYGVEENEVPLTYFSIRLKGGMLLDDINKVGVANMTAELMKEGTANKTPEQLQDAIGQLGAKLNITATSEFIEIEGNCLAKNFDEMLKLTEEVLLQPRWDEKEFARIKQSTISKIQQSDSNPAAISNNVFNKILFGKDHIFSQNILGTQASVEGITIDDLKAYYAKAFSPTVSSFHVVGAISQIQVMESLKRLEANWAKKDVIFPTYSLVAPAKVPALYFVDVQGAKQSNIRIGGFAPARGEAEYNAANFANYRLGDGGSGRLFQILREEKGYTYGAYSFINARKNAGAFIATSGVKSDVTLESVQTFKEILTKYASTYTEEDANITKTSLTRQNTSRFETPGDLINILEEISTYDLPLDYIKKEEDEINAMTIDKVKEMITKYIDPSKMIYVVVGDAQTQLKKLEQAGIGKPILLDKQGNPVVK